MGDNIAELNSGGVIVRRIGAGGRMGFSKPTPAFAISTNDRSGTADYIVLTREEAVKVAFSILKDEDKRRKNNGRAVAELGELLGVNVEKLMEFDRESSE